MASGNKGEWSEFYAFLKMLDEQKLNVAGPNLEMRELAYPVVRVLRSESDSVKTYKPKNGNVELKRENEETEVINIKGLQNTVREIFESIKGAEESSFTIELGNEWMRRLHCKQLKAGSDEKSDIEVVIHDFKVGRETQVGFSIKSNAGSAPTLLNASSHTNFVYKVEGFDGDIARINDIDERPKVMNRIEAIEEAGGELSFHKVDSNVFEENLRRIDSFMPEMAAQYIYFKFSGEESDIKELTSAVSNRGELKASNYEFETDDYRYKIKGLLHASALGMQPGSSWDGKLETSGGYIVVREDGEVVCYHLYNGDAFREYLYQNTKLETPSTSRHGFAELYEESGELFFKLNLQIRFSN